MLYLVATPIGNLEDITARALRVLREVDVIAAEDTRHTRKLLSHFQIGTQLVSYHEHSDASVAFSLVRRMKDGEKVALVTDAGTPAISDPGHDLVVACVEGGIRVEPIPGPTAPISALIASGLPTARFVFEGFLPRTKSTRLDRIKALGAEPRTLVFFESSPRLVDTLGELVKILGERPACVAREMTKIHEEFQRGCLNDLAVHYKTNPPKGECVIVVAGAQAGTKIAPVEEAPQDAGVNELIKRLASRLGLARRDVYDAVVRLRNKG